MKIVFIGTGYVGLVSGACLAKLKHEVTCVDIDSDRIAKLCRGEDIFYEPGLSKVVKSAVRAKKLNFTTKLSECLPGAEAVFIAVGTPQDRDGSADLSYVKSAARNIGRHLKNYVVIVNKSTVPVGTAELVRRTVKRYTRVSFDMASNPEFLREGNAVDDFLHPDRVVVGIDSQKAERIMRRVYAPLSAEKMFTEIPTAELVKYASNSFLATKLSFINEIANFSEKVGADIDDVAAGVGLDSRIGPKFLKAGLGFGGSCFPKDVSALRFMSKSKNFNFRIIDTVLKVNARQKKLFYEKIKKQFRGKLGGKKIAILGLAFKGNTDDVRESPALSIVRWLLRDGAEVVAFDPQAAEQARAKISRLVTVKSAAAAIEGSEAVIIATEWEQFKALPWHKLKTSMKKPIIIDGRNLLNPVRIRQLGYSYTGIGKP